MHVPSPDFSQVRDALFARTPRYVPLAELKVDEDVMAAFLGRPYAGLPDLVDFQLRAGYDYVRVRPAYSLIYEGRTDVTAKYSVYGAGSKTISWAQEHEGRIRSRADFDGYPFPTLDDVDFSNLREVHRLLPDGMKIMSSVTGIWESVWMLMGFETFCFACYDDPRLVADLFERLAVFHFDVFSRAIDSPGVGAMWYTDDLAYATGPMIDPALLRRYVFPWVRRMGDLCRERDMPFVFHSDGDVSSLIDDLLAAGVTALHPIEPKALDAAALKRAYRGRLALVGNIDVDLLSRASPDVVRRVTADRIRSLGPDGYCVGSANSIPSWVPIDNFRAMTQTALSMRGS
ncbi:MAG: uroporphyrinogen decarboxylase family protein [Planctomycetota bacterium]